MDEVVFDSRRIREILAEFGSEVEGEWLLLGGALVAVWLDDRRVTEDLDLIPVRRVDDARDRLLDFAYRRGLPVESVNSAADFFVHRIPGWQEQLEEWMRTPHCTIYRPTPTLFLLLKIGRLSQQDLEDCLLLLDHCRGKGLAIDGQRVETALAALKSAPDAGVTRRRAVLARRLAEHGS